MRFGICGSPFYLSDQLFKEVERLILTNLAHGGLQHALGGGVLLVALGLQTIKPQLVEGPVGHP